MHRIKPLRPLLPWRLVFQKLKLKEAKNRHDSRQGNRADAFSDVQVPSFTIMDEEHLALRPFDVIWKTVGV